MNLLERLGAIGKKLEALKNAHGEKVRKERSEYAKDRLIPILRRSPQR